jgi:hypothetical protein
MQNQVNEFVAAGFIKRCAARNVDPIAISEHFEKQGMPLGMSAAVRALTKSAGGAEAAMKYISENAGKTIGPELSGSMTKLLKGQRMGGGMSLLKQTIPAGVVGAAIDHVVTQRQQKR